MKYLAISDPSLTVNYRTSRSCNGEYRYLDGLQPDVRFRVRKSLQTDKVLGEAGTNRVATLYTLFPPSLNGHCPIFRFVSPRFPSINYFESEIVTINPRNEDTPRYYPISSKADDRRYNLVWPGDTNRTLLPYRLLKMTVNCK